MNLHARIAKVLGWSLADVQSFSLPALREMVRKASPKLAHEISCVIRSDDYYKGDKYDPRKKR